MKSLTTVIIFTILIFTKTFAHSCTNKESVVCEIEPNESWLQKEVCINNTLLGQYFSNNPQSLPFSCLDFSLKKIKTYACNAGLKYFTGDNNEHFIDPSLNFFTLGIAEYKDPTPIEDFSYIQKSVYASSTDDFSQATKKSGSHMIEDGSKLQFHLGSEFYGAQYFVDLCILNKNLTPESFDLNIVGKVLFTQSLFNQDSYIKDAQVLSTIEVICQNDNNIFTKILSSESPFISAEKNYTSLLPPGNQCYIRHLFKENASDKFRSNKYKKISFQTQLYISVVDESLLNLLPIKYCQIKKSRSKFICQEKIFNNGDELIQDALKGYFSSNDMFTGACPNPCNLK